MAGDAPEVLNMPPGTIDFEKIAALKLDLIVGVHSGITEYDSGALSQIAPVVAQSPDYIDYGMPCDDSRSTAC